MSKSISEGLKKAYKEGRHRIVGFPKGNKYGAITGKKNKGRKRPDMVGNKINLGKKLSKEHREKIGKAQLGEKSHWWKGGVYNVNRTEYQKYNKAAEWGHWRREVFERDEYTCQDCGIKGSQTGGHLEPHHIIPIRELIKNNLIDLIYEVSNGLTLCRKCHMKTFKRKC